MIKEGSRQVFSIYSNDQLGDLRRLALVVYHNYDTTGTRAYLVLNYKGMFVIYQRLFDLLLNYTHFVRKSGGLAR